MGKFRFLEFQDDDLEDQKTSTGEAAAQGEFAQLLESEGAKATEMKNFFRVGEKVSGHVIQVGKESLFVDLGSKLTGTIARSEFTDSVPAENEFIELYVKAASGSEVLLTKVLKTESTGVEELLQAREALTPVEAKIEKVVNGGFQAKLGSHRAFIPISHMELYSQPGKASPLDKPDEYVGKSFSFHILEVKEGGKNILLSRRNLLKLEQEELTRKTLNELAEGETRTATVTKLMPFGAFAQIAPGVEGLIPLGELAWKRVSKASDVVQEGDEVQVKVVSITHSPKLRIGLSLKDAGTDPWLLAVTRLRPGENCTGKVTRVSEFGAFVEVDEGIEGLVHISQLSWTKRVRHPSEILKPGQTAQFKILGIEAQERRLSLSFKGDMPEEMRAKAKQLSDRGDALSSEEQEIMDSWKNYQTEAATKAQAKHNGAPDSSSSAFAAAFQLARSRKKG